MSFCVGKNPDLPNMMVSYSATIAKDKFYNGVMTLIEDENGNFQKIFPDLKNILKSAENMTLDYRNDDKFKPHSEYTLYCCGFDGGITGRTRAHNVLYVDDLIKNIEEARNKDVLDKKWEEFTGTLKKRMQGNCKMLLIGTIFSINDPLSRIIKYYKDRDPNRIEIIKVPGLNENNETNFNYKYGFALTTEALLEDKDLMDTVSFECLIQQNPIERLGIVFSEEELRKFFEEPEYGLQRRIAAVDVAWGGGDSLSMPICSEYDNKDIYLTDVIFSKGKKEETIPMVVNAIINYQITACHFEANNGGDMYAEKVQEELKARNYRCNITWSKVPTTKSKLDRILAVQGAIKGVAASEYRLLVKERKAIKNNKMYNDFLDELTKFNQSPSVQGKQHDDSCFEGNTLIATQFGYKKIKDIKIGDKVITPFGLRKVTSCGITGFKETINKFGLNVTPDHKVYNRYKNIFSPIDSFTTLNECDIISLGGLLKWKKKLLNLMGKHIKEAQRADIILSTQQETKTENIANNYTELYGNTTMEKYLKAIKYTIKIRILTIMTLATWSVFQLGNICRNMLKKIGKTKNIEKECQNLCKEIQKGNKNVKLGIKAKKEENGIENMQKEAYLKTNLKKKENVVGVEKNTLQEWQCQNIVQYNVKEKQSIIENQENALCVEKNFTQQEEVPKCVQENVELKIKNKKIPVYNITVENAGCYYANGILVSNCDSLASLFTNVLGATRVGKARSRFSREDLGI